MRLEVLPDATAVARRAAGLIAAAARHAVAERGRFTLAVSGGHTPWIMLQALAAEEVPWEAVHLFQVDERVAPSGHADRNLTHIHESLAADAPLAAASIHAMPVDEADLARAAARYAADLRSLAGSPAVLDLVHLGLGADGHTASLVPGDAVLKVTDADVAVTAAYQGRRRMTLTFPALDRARELLWVVTGAEKATIVPRLCAKDPSIPAGRVRADRALVLLDAPAAALAARR